MESCGEPATRKLIEVALPLEAVNAAGRAEKAVPKKGHPATMHLWWSRKPLGVARAVLFASLVDDPAARPDLYPTEAAAEVERRRLLALIEGLCRWERSGDTALLAEAQRAIDASAGGEPPVVIDPFCGSGTIASEAMRLGLDALAVDLNPVAALVSAATLSIAQRFAGRPAVHPDAPAGAATGDGSPLAGIAADVARYGADVEAQCRRRLDGVFGVPAGAPTVAVSYLWARTITCANPGCGRTTPLLSTWWVSKKATNRWHARPVLSDGGFGFDVLGGPPPADLADLKVGRGANYRCLHCATVNDAEAVRRHGQEAGFGLRLVAVQAFADPVRRRGRFWLAPDEATEQAGLIAPADGDLPPPVAAALGRELPATGGNIAAFGAVTFGDLLTPRQRRTLATFSEVIAALVPRVHRHALAAAMSDDDGVGVEAGGAGAAAYAEAVTTYLGLTLSRLANRTTTMTIHNRANGSVEQSFVQPAYAFYGDFPEANPFSGSTGSWAGALGYVVNAVAELPAPAADAPVRVGRVEVRCASAPEALEALDGARGVVCTDPPYYDTFDYAALSNHFLVWQRATLGHIWPGTLGPLLAPTCEQVVSNPARHGGDRAAAHVHFETLLRRAFERIREVQDPRYPITVYYAYQQSERSRRAGGDGPGTAWEALLESLIGAGLRVTATWPLRTERPEGVKKGTRALASSVLLVCRPAEAGAEGAPAPAITVGELRRALRAELPAAVRLLRQGSIAPLDLLQAAIGPGMAVYTRYPRVRAADGSDLGVRAALAMINEVLDETLSGGGANLDADSRWALNWFDDHGFGEGPFGPAEQLSKAHNTSVAGLMAAGIVVAAGDRVRLVRREELPEDWDPAAGGRRTVWAATQHLLRRHGEGGDRAAAALLRRLDPDTAEAARDLTYRLFDVCSRRNRGAEAAACNSLVSAWIDLARP